MTTPAIPETVEAVPEAPEAATPEPGADGFAALNERLAGIESRLPEQQAEAAPSNDLFSQFAQIAQEYDPYQEEQQVQAPGEPETPGQLDPEEARIQAAIDARVQQAVDPFRQQQEEFLISQEIQRRQAELSAYVNQYPDVRDPARMDQIGQHLSPLAAQYGDGVYTDPTLVRLVDQAMRAEAAASNETPAVAAGRGANLETQAGPGAVSEERNPIKEALAPDAPKGQFFR